MTVRGQYGLGVAAGIALLFSSAASAAPPAGFSEQDRADTNCIAAVSIAIGSELPGQSLSAEAKSGMATVLTYFVGKLKGRYATLKMADVVTPELYAQISPKLAEEMKRCGAEAIAMGEDLQDAGRILTAVGR